MISKIFLPCLLFIMFILNYEVKCKKNTANKQIDECRRCKILSESFEHWFKITSRGKHEGGDAAWEETKLKSYARSEMRLVEIQEGLCSEVKQYQDACYALSEEVEQVLEKMWFDEDLNTLDLYTRLCINTLQYCCPKNYFGEACLLCPVDKHDKVCSDHGRCDGDGTRKGNGTCICKKGYSGTFCNECASNFYMVDTEQCAPCHKACKGCMGEGVSNCKTCNVGWQLESGICVDINECSDINPCTQNQYCENKEGSFSCATCDMTCSACDGKGPNKCTSCSTEKTLLSGICVDTELKHELLANALKKLILYTFLTIITIFVFQRKKLLASVMTVFIAMFIYNMEKTSQINIIMLLISL